MTSIWDRAAQNPPEESSGFLDLPPEAWVLGQTAGVDNGKAAPEIRTTKVKDKNSGQDRESYQFSVGLLCQGGDGKIEPSHRGGMMWADGLWIHPAPDTKDPGILGGRFTGFLNSMFAAGVEKSEDNPNARWLKTISILQAAAQEAGLNQDEFPALKDDGLFLATCAVAALKKQPRTILFRTKLRTFKYTKGEKKGQEGSRLEIGTFEDDTPANREKRGVKVIQVGVEF